MRELILVLKYYIKNMDCYVIIMYRWYIKEIEHERSRSDMNGVDSVVFHF